MKKTLIITSFILLIISCEVNNDKDLRKSILKYCSKKSGCTLKISDITKFTWTKMYVFRYNATNEEVQKIIGLNYPYYKEFTDRIVFINNDSIVYHEENKTNIEGVDKDDVIFNFNDTLKYECYTPSEAQFELTSVEGSNGRYYEMNKH